MLIAGFVISGNQAKKVIVRALGPTLSTLGVGGALADPTITIFNSSHVVVASNDNWRDKQQSEIAASGYAPNLLDAYFGAAQPGQAGRVPGVQELGAMQALGLFPSPAAESLQVDTGSIYARGEALRAESLATGNYVLGVDMFRRTTTQFLPLLSGPVSPDYKLGPGDQLVLIIPATSSASTPSR